MFNSPIGISRCELGIISSDYQKTILKQRAVCTRMYKDPWGLHQRNYISWREAVCHFPHFISGPSKRTDRSENEETLALDLPSSNFRIAGGHPYKWAINLPAIRAEIDDDGYDGRDEQKFLWYFDSFLNALLEEEAGGDELASYNYIQSRN